MEQLYLGIEGGGTRTVALFATAAGKVFRRIEAGPGNVRLLNDNALRQLLRTLASAARDLPAPTAIGIGMAGARDEAQWGRMRAAAAKIWPGVPCHATHDLDTALAAAEPPAGPNRRAVPPGLRVLVLSGTGSCCFARDTAGRTARFGGWGHLLGDKGSGYEIGLRALKASVFYFDRDGTWPRLGQRILRALQLNEPNDLIGWVQGAGKSDIAALAPEVFAARTEKDRIAGDILEGAAHSLAKDAIACAKKLAAPGTPAEFVLTGGVLLRQPAFAREVARGIRKLWPGARVAQLAREGAWGAVVLARRMAAPEAYGPPAGKANPAVISNRPAIPPPAPAPSLPPTEQRNPRSRNLDRLSVSDAIALMLREDARIPAALLAERARIARVIGWIVRSLRGGGQLFYVGAGTSGRLGILDASECPPTFRTAPEQVQGIIAGGQRALWQAVEGAEDDLEGGARAVAFRDVRAGDVVVGIAASGRTPFVRGALREARARGARTVLLCFNPGVRLAPDEHPQVVIAPALGPEVLTGSTRLKAGTATKLVLNLFTTLAMVRLGKVVSNLMVDLNPSNVKLRDRAVRIVRELTGCDAPAARAALEESGWVVKAAWQKLRRRQR